MFNSLNVKPEYYPSLNDLKTKSSITPKYSTKKIDIDFDNVKHITILLKNINKIINNCQNNIETNYLKDELKIYYQQLNDNTTISLNELELYITSLLNFINTSVDVYKDTDTKNYNELKNLISYLFDVHEETSNMVSEGEYINIENEEIGQITLLTADEYMNNYNEMNVFFDEQYSEIIEKFKVKLKIQYQTFLAKTVPTVLNTVVEEVYTSRTQTKYDSSEYYSGLKDFKEQFANNIYGQYNVNNINIQDSKIPEYLWTNSTSYDRALLCLSYTDDISVMQDNFTKAITSYENPNFNKCDEYFLTNYQTTFNMFRTAKELFLSDVNGENIKSVIKKYKDFFKKSDILPGANNSLIEHINMGCMGADYSIKQTAWINSLKNNGYLKDELSKYSDDELFESTYNMDFLTGLLMDGGENKLRALISDFYNNVYTGQDIDIDYLVDGLLNSEENYANGVISLANRKCYNEIIQGLSPSFDELCTNKATLDAAKQNYKLSLLKSMDVSSVTDDNIISAKEKLGNNAKYLEDWQIKAYALLNNMDERYGNLLLNDTLYYNIESGKGYDSAKEEIYQMTGETIKQCVKSITKSDVLGSIFGDTIGSFLGGTYALIGGAYDGIYNSIEGVYEFGEGLLDIVGFDSEDRMNANDYRKSYLQQFLSGNYSLLDPESDKEFFEFLNSKKDQLGVLRVEYNLASSVGNMAIPMLLSSFVSPAAMSAWMFASVAGNEKKQMLIDGREKDASTYLLAASKGLIAVASERMLGSLKGYGAKENEILGIFKNYDKYSNFGKFIAGTLSNQVNEVGEELFENACDHVLDYVFDGKIPEGKEMLAETWETAYMTFLSTPLINFMGSSFQNSNYSLINRQQTHNINGIDAKYSQSELMQFVDKDGNLDNAKFMDYLRKNDRLSTIELDFDTVKKYEIPNIYKISFDTRQNLYVLEYMDGHIDKVNDLSQVTKYNPNDNTFKINGNYYTKEQIELFESKLKLFTSKGDIVGNKVEYSQEKIQEVRDTILGLAGDDADQKMILSNLANTLVAQMERGNPNTEQEYKNIVRLIKEKGLIVEYWDYNRTAFFDPNNKIGFEKNTPINFRINLHEFAHAMHFHFDGMIKDGYGEDFHTPTFNEEDNNYYINYGNNQYNYSNILKNTRTKVANGNFALFNNYVHDKMIQNGYELMLNDLRSQGKSYDDILSDKFNEYLNKYNNSDYKEILKTLKLNKNNTYISSDELKKAAEIEVFRPYKSSVIDSDDNYTMIRSFSDTVDSIFGGRHNYNLMAGHGEGYYGGRELNSISNHVGVDHQFAESVAQIIPLIQLSPDTIPFLYEMFGDEYMNMIMNSVDTIFSDVR